MATTTLAPLPKVEAKAALVSSTPAPPLLKSMGVPLMRITRAVMVQITVVSANTSKMPNRPCCTGPLVSAAAWAIGAEPKPASLENTPRATPLVMALVMVMPTAPPTTAEGLKAPTKMALSTGPMLPMWEKITMREDTM